ncbi:MAG: hypothetical protein ACPGSC_11695, partial [Granulosicoccaceae bacterium]
EFEQLISRAKSNNTAELFQRAASIANLEAPVIPLWHISNFDLVSLNLNGYQPQLYVTLENLELND